MQANNIKEDLLIANLYFNLSPAKLSWFIAMLNEKFRRLNFLFAGIKMKSILKTKTIYIITIFIYSLSQLHKPAVAEKLNGVKARMHDTHMRKVPIGEFN